MRRILVSLACLGALSLGAQTPTTLEGLAAAEWRAMPFWVVLDDAKATFSRAFRDAMKEDGASELGLRLQLLESKTHAGLLKDLAGRSGWTGPRWALVDPQGRILAQGAKPPKAAELLAAALEAGVRPRSEVLGTFLKAHPDHVEAMEELLVVQLGVAAQRMEKWLPPTEPGEVDGQLKEDPRVPKQPLTDAEDARIWGPAARLLTRFYLEDHFIHNAQLVPASLPPVARHSALMREAARKALPKVEEGILRDPRRWTHWVAWRALDQWTGHTRSARRLFEAAPGIPGRRAYFPADATRAFNREAVANKDWSGLAGFLQSMWDSEREEGMGWKSPEGTKDADYQLNDLWDRFGPLIEAHLRLGNERRASLTVEELLQHCGFRGITRRASALAQSVKKPELAQRWAALQPPKPEEGNSLEMGKTR